MKKKMIALLAGALMMISASSAFAAFNAGDLIRVVYNHAGTVEVATDLGSITSLLSGGALAADTFSLGSITGATSASDLYVAYFASTGSPGTGYVGANAAPVTGSRKFTAFSNGYQNLESYYQSLSATATTVNGAQANTNSYNTGMSFAGNGYGMLNGYLPLGTGEENLAALIARGGQTTIYAFGGQSGTSGVTTGTATALVLNTNYNAITGIGSTSTPTATPIPAAAWLLGSGLMGLLGLRRKSIKA